MPQIGIIGGSGIYKMGIIEDEKDVVVETPFGRPSDAIIVGHVGETEVAFLPRHGSGHFIPPHKINNPANIFALKQLGVEVLISTAAVGSLREDFKPQDFVIADQLVDRTAKRRNTFFEDGVVAHVSLADPFCPVVSKLAFDAVKKADVNVHNGSYLCMEGPQFSTRKESELYRKWGLEVIGMTLAPEAKLAREAQMCMTGILAVTDYDCWYAEEEDVSVSSVVENLQKNTEHMKEVLQILIPTCECDKDCDCRNALEHAVITSPELLEENLDPRIRDVLF